MIDRSYLPFYSAREYVDRGMAKWAGFFISEHATSLEKEEKTIDYSLQMEKDQLVLLLGQAYVHRLPVLLYTKIQPEPFICTISELSENTISFRTEEQRNHILFEDILRLELWREKNEK